MFKKKNDFQDNELLVSQSGFPDGVRVYSSDDEDDDQESFIVINRELEYLKQNTLEYFKKQRMNHVAQALGENVWLDYTDQVEAERTKAEEKNRAKALARKKRYAIRAHPRRRHYAQAEKAEDIILKRKSNDMSFGWPIDRSSFWLSSFFGPRKHKGRWTFHRGVDMAAVKGTPVNAVCNGVVVEARYATGYGKTVVIAHNAKYRTRYAHLNTILVKVGQKVDRGERIGKVGATGFVRSKRGGDASHLHFEVHAFGKQVNPMYFLG
jgi:murein DD-endopeptidase MepM/ murein hydrolase activator NlpD